MIRVITSRRVGMGEYRIRVNGFLVGGVRTKDGLWQAIRLSTGTKHFFRTRKAAIQWFAQ